MQTPITEMSPLKLEILLWYYHSPCEYPKIEVPYIKETIYEFCKLGLLKWGDGKYEAVRDALDVYVNAILAVPLPKQIWVCENKIINDKTHDTMMRHEPSPINKIL